MARNVKVLSTEQIIIVTDVLIDALAEANKDIIDEGEVRGFLRAMKVVTKTIPTLSKD